MQRKGFVIVKLKFFYLQLWIANNIIRLQIRKVCNAQKVDCFKEQASKPQCQIHMHLKLSTINSFISITTILFITYCPTILEKGRPALFVSGWFAKMLTAATVVCRTAVALKWLWVYLASHNQLRDTLLVVEMWLY